MINDNAQLETIYRIYPANGRGEFLEVFVDEDEMIRIQTTDKNSEVYFGKISVSLEKEVAKKLTEALKALT